MKSSTILAALAVALHLGNPRPVQAETLVELAAHTHYHGIAFARSGDATLLIATHHGIFSVDRTGNAQPVSSPNDYMGFSADPSNPLGYFASGHPKEGGNSGFLKSGDGGANWIHVADGAGGPVDFHAMTVSIAEPRTIYGAFRGIQVSVDAGETWTVTGPAPSELIALASSAFDPNKLYAATLEGVLVSADSGATWQSFGLAGAQVSLVETTPSGQMFAFAVGQGLMSVDELKPEGWVKLSNDFGNDVPLHLAVDYKDNKHVVVTTQDNAILESRDGGRTFVPFSQP